MPSSFTVPAGEGATAPLPLTGLRVLDIATFLAAPIAATLLAEFGAEVIKVEDPVGGDFPRWHGGGTEGHTALWAQEGRNKQSVTIDLRTSEGQQLVRDLAVHCDVVVTNTRPATAARWGLTPDEILALDDQLIVLAITGFGLTGPYRDRGAFDRIASAYSGHTYVSGQPDQAPVRSGFATIDYLGAYAGAFGVMTALRARDAGAGGQVIDLSLTDVAVRASEASPAAYAASGRLRERVGNRNPTVVPASEVEAGDGRRVSYHAGSPSLFRRLAEAIGHPELPDDPRFVTHVGRVENQDALYALITAWIGERPAAEVVERLDAAGVPATTVNNAADLLADPHLTARGTFETVEDRVLGPLPLSAPVPRLTKTPGETRHPGPDLGSSTDQVLRDLLDLDDDAITALHDRGVV